MLIVLGIYSIFHRGILKKFHVSTIVLLLLTVFVGIERNKSVEKTFSPIEATHSMIKPYLNSFDFPTDSQIVITGPSVGYLYTGGYWVWSTGYLKYTTGRKDITGIVGKEFFFYNPFDPKQRGYSYPMRGLDLNKPIFLYRLNNNKLVQVAFFLQWFDENENGKWNFYAADVQAGHIKLLKTGHGKKEFLSAVSDLNISSKDVYWAPSQKTALL